MPEKIGLEALFMDKQFREGAKRYLKAQDQMEKANKDMKESMDKSGKSIDDLGDDMKKGGQSALDLAAQMVVVKQAMNVVKELAGKGLELAKLGATAEAHQGAEPESVTDFVENDGQELDIGPLIPVKPVVPVGARETVFIVVDRTVESRVNVVG